MTTNASQRDRIVGSLRYADGTAVVRMEDRFDTNVEDLWAALTDPARLARWYGEIEGDLRVGGEYRARLFASGWEGMGRIDACEPPHRLLVMTTESADDLHGTIEVTLAADGDETVLVLEERGMPLDMIAAYGAGIQVHVEDLRAPIAGRERVDAQARWAELMPAYQELAAGIELGPE
jgi:uncharacterized protein YndB with AHSA1/START domain